MKKGFVRDISTLYHESASFQGSFRTSDLKIMERNKHLLDQKFTFPWPRYCKKAKKDANTDQRYYKKK